MWPAGAETGQHGEVAVEGWGDPPDHMGDRPVAGWFRARVAAVVAAIPPGTVATYGEVAVEAGFAVGASRAVGNVLQQVEGLPWWRVVTASGRLVPGAEERHAALLLGEGVAVEGGRVRLRGRRAHR